MNPRLVEIEALLDESVQRVGRAVSNMRELAVSGLPSSTPGNGSPGGGKGGGRSLTIDMEIVPVSSVEASALAGEPDTARRMLAELTVEVDRAANAAASTVFEFTSSSPIWPASNATPIQMVVFSYSCARVLVHLDVPDRWSPSGGWGRWEHPVRRVWQLTQSWGWVPAEPTPSQQRELMATDLTGQWCRSCLRAGARESRDRNNEMCTWCRKFEQAEGFAPPLELVKARADNQRITEAMVIPYRQAHRDRMKRAGRRSRDGTVE